MDGTAAGVLDKPAFRKVDWLQRDIAVERRDDGVIIMQSRIPLQQYGPHIPASLAKWEQLWTSVTAGGTPIVSERLLSIAPHNGPLLWRTSMASPILRSRIENTAWSWRLPSPQL